MKNKFCVNIKSAYITLVFSVISFVVFFVGLLYVLMGQYNIVTIILTVIFGLLFILFLAFAIYYFSLKIELTKAAISKTLFGKILKTLTYEEIICVKLFIENPERVRDEWIFLSNQAIDEFRENKNIICFLCFPNSLKIVYEYAPKNLKQELVNIYHINN